MKLTYHFIASKFGCYASSASSHFVFIFFYIFLMSTIFSQRAGAVFPQRSERTAPVFTPPQTQPLTSFPQNLRNPEYRQEGAESSTESEFPTLRYIY